MFIFLRSNKVDWKESELDCLKTASWRPSASIEGKAVEIMNMEQPPVHTETCFFTCGNCGATFVSKETMMDHLLSVHTGKLPYKCRDDCGSTFNSDKNLKLNILSNHLQSKPYKCGKCTSAYTSKRALKLAVHSGKKPHKCGDCKQSYITASCLKRHELSIHRGGRHFACGNCRSTFVC